MKQVVTVGLTVLAGAALLEVALVPGILIGGAAVLAPKLLPNLLPDLPINLPGLRRRRKRAANAAARSRPATGLGPLRALEVIRPLASVLPKFELGQAIAKTITFRVIVTALDFTTNYVVIGELATAAGLSSFNFVAGPLFYLGHEAVWNYLDDHLGDAGLAAPAAGEAAGGIVVAGVAVSRALAKTVTFRSIASTMDFTVNYLVVGDLGMALLLSATGLILGPFVYYGHEKAWEYFGRHRAEADDAADGPKLLPAPV